MNEHPNLVRRRRLEWWFIVVALELTVWFIGTLELERLRSQFPPEPAGAAALSPAVILKGNR